ncbi:signal peptidase I [Klenkia sp. LSe6-5]|uniref:Signal peptidase I n=1 Tax=Klenkia sesuvii TaxID=3103137 RepID=A0ABU8DWV5_9ACTN
MRHRVVLAVQLTTLAALVVGHLLGVRVVPVLTASMDPWAAAGSLVVTVPVDGADVVHGDVVAFRPPAPWEVPGGRPILHRVDGLAVVDGVPTMTTRGDANPTADPWRVSLAGARLGRAVTVVPFLGRAFEGGPGPVVAVLAGGVVVAAGLRRMGAGRAGADGAPACPDCAPVPA